MMLCRHFVDIIFNILYIRFCNLYFLLNDIVSGKNKVLNFFWQKAMSINKIYPLLLR